MVHVSGRDGLQVGQAQAVARPRPLVGRRQRGRAAQRRVRLCEP